MRYFSREARRLSRSAALVILSRDLPGSSGRLSKALPSFSCRSSNLLNRFLTVYSCPAQLTLTTKKIVSLPLSNPVS